MKLRAIYERFTSDFTSEQNKNKTKKQKNMELNDYQKKAMETCMDTCKNDSYMLLNLVAEVGEFTGKIAKAIRKKDCRFDDGDYLFYKHTIDELKLEAGDILWQLAGLCKMMGWTLEDVAQANLDKLASRKERGVIDGNGDHR